MAYVAAHSNRTLSPYYKFSALWSGQEGSLLFWSFLLSIYVFSALFTYRGKHPELMPYVGVVLAGVQIFFLTMNNFIASPFRSVCGAAAPAGFCTWRRAPMAAASIRCCSIRRWRFIRRLCIPATRASRFRLRLLWPRCSGAIRERSGFT